MSEKIHFVEAQPEVIGGWDLFDKPGNIHAKVTAWNLHRQSFLESLTHCHGSHNEDDVLAMIITGEYQLWVTPKAGLVTFFVTYPRFKALNGFITGGAMEGLYEIAPRLLAWAIRHGCKRIIGGGRHGWLREAGAATMGQIMYKDI